MLFLAKKKKQQKGVYFSAAPFRPQRYMETSCKAAGIVYAAITPKEIV